MVGPLFILEVLKAWSLGPSCPVKFGVPLWTSQGVGLIHRKFGFHLGPRDCELIV